MLHLTTVSITISLELPFLGSWLGGQEVHRSKRSHLEGIKTGEENWNWKPERKKKNCLVNDSTEKSQRSKSWGPADVKVLRRHPGRVFQVWARAAFQVEESSQSLPELSRGKPNCFKSVCVCVSFCLRSSACYLLRSNSSWSWYSVNSLWNRRFSPMTGKTSRSSSRLCRP